MIEMDREWLADVRKDYNERGPTYRYLCDELAEAWDEIERLQTTVDEHARRDRLLADAIKHLSSTNRSAVCELRACNEITD